MRLQKSNVCFADLFKQSSTFLLTPHCAHDLIGFGQCLPRTLMSSNSNLYESTSGKPNTCSYHIEMPTKLNNKTVFRLSTITVQILSICLLFPAIVL